MTTTEWSKPEVVLYKWSCVPHSNNEAGRCPLLSVGSLGWHVGHVKFLLEVASKNT